MSLFDCRALNVDLTYLQLLFALRTRNLSSLEAMFIGSALAFFEKMEQHWDSLVGDVERGTVTGASDAFVAELRAGGAELGVLLQPDVERANELRAAAASGFDKIADRIWVSSSGRDCVQCRAVARRTGAFGGRFFPLRAHFASFLAHRTISLTCCAFAPRCPAR